MINLKNFKPYFPKEPPYSNALYLRAESGEDWYECQKGFGDDSLKVAYNSDGVIVSAGTDVSGMFPSGLSVAEVSVDGVPELELLIRGGWSYQNGEVVAIAPTLEQQIESAETQKKLLLNQCNNTITPLQDAVDLGIATQEEESALKAWKKYRVLLNRVDTSTAPDIDWPEKPVTQ